MQGIVTLCVILGTVVGKPRNVSKTAEATRVDGAQEGHGNFKFNINTSDGLHHNAQGQFRNRTKENKNNGELVVTGKYSYNGPEGTTHSVSYTADKNGFKPTVKYTLNTKDTTTLAKSSQSVNITSTTTNEMTQEGSTLPPLNIGELCLTCSIPGKSKE